jgi:hypothetical protein
VTLGKIGAVALAILVGGYVAGAPYLVAYQMKSAAEANDGEALSEHIEFPSVRQSLKDQMNASLAKGMYLDAEIQDNPFAALGAAFAGVMVDKMVDTYVNPAGITQMMAGEKPQSTDGSNDSSNQEKQPFSNASMSYTNANKFVISVLDDERAESRFILRRRGLEWKLTEILIPLD